jgi:NADH dehydrogenase
VINLAGILFESGKQSFSTVQTTGAEKLAHMARAAGVEVFIQMSALGVEKASGSRYASSKLMGEKAVQTAFPTATILRPSIVFGEEDNFFNQFATIAGFSPVLPLIGGGTTKFQPVYVDDVAKAIEAALSNKNMRGKIYELGGPKIYSFKEILQFITTTIYKPRCLTTLPYGLANIVGFFNELLPRPMITRDQIKLLKQDNIVSANTLTFADIGITPQNVEAIVPHYLARFAPYQKVAA